MELLESALYTYRQTERQTDGITGISTIYIHINTDGKTHRWNYWNQHYIHTDRQKDRQMELLGDTIKLCSDMYI